MPQAASDLVYHDKINQYNLKLKQSKVSIFHLCLVFQASKFNSQLNILKPPATACIYVHINMHIIFLPLGKFYSNSS